MHICGAQRTGFGHVLIGRADVESGTGALLRELVCTSLAAYAIIGLMVRQPLQDRVVIVTGASRRGAIGAAIARRVVQDGASVLVHSWVPHDAEQPWGADQDGPEALIQELRGIGGRAEHVSADLADPDAPAALIEAGRAAFGHVDAVVLNHARSSSQGLEELTCAELDLSYAVNTRATLLLVKAFAAQHDDGRPGGRVLVFTSGQYHGAMPNELPYIASKAAPPSPPSA